jgi:hypothetical protein
LFHPPNAEARPITLTSIQAGLGNQLFQYAIARRLSISVSGDLVLILADDFSGRYQRRFGLQHFNVSGHIVYQSQIKSSLPNLFPNRPMPDQVTYEKLIFHCIGEQTKDPIFNPEILTLRGSVQLQGFWQDERYFTDIADVIRQDCTLKTELSERNRIMRARILGAPSAFIHVRRGDYLAPQHIDLFGVCAPDYYHAAVELLRSRHGRHINIYVFSDDFGWVRETAIGGPDAELVDWNSDAPWDDLYLMRACQHAVIANSSFGWWGAWLGDWPGRTVVAPKLWFKATPQYTEIVPPRWLRI